MAERIVCLNSGGLDSVTMVTELRRDKPNAEIYSLFFDYGQRSRKIERKKVKALCKKLDLVDTRIKIPKISWGNSNFYGNEFISIVSQYLEFRNLIFLSYALSYAESIFASEIYMAVIKHHHYKDTSIPFLNNFDTLSHSSANIRLVTPYKELEKSDIIQLAYGLGISTKDFHSCDTPKNGKPCGECVDCKSLEGIEDYFKQDTPSKIYAKTFDPNNYDFQKQFYNSHINEARLLINDNCQLNCDHCFYGDYIPSTQGMGYRDWGKVINECISVGITNFHFSGKEPLFDDDIFHIASYLVDREGVTYDLVTNGINVPRYAPLIKSKGFSKVFLSVDDILIKGGVRKVSGVTEKALNSLNKENIPVEIFIDIHKDNYKRIGDIIQYLSNEFGVKNFYVRTITPVGNAVNLERLPDSYLDEVFNQLKSEYFSPLTIKLFIGLEYTYSILDSDVTSDFKQAIESSIVYQNGWFTDWLHVIPHFYCQRFEDQITITPEGNVLGCAMDVSYPDHKSCRAGNILEEPLIDILDRGKCMGIEANKILTTKCPDLQLS